MAKIKYFSTKLKKLNLGCGRDIRKNYVNIDFTKMLGIDVVHDLNKFPYPFKDNTFEEIECRHVVCLLEDPVKVMEELHRICKNGAIIKIFDVYYNCSSPGNDPYLKRTFNENSFNWLDKTYSTGYYTSRHFKILKRDLIPTRLGKMIPKFMRKTTSIVIGEVIKNVYFEIQVVKKS